MTQGLRLCNKHPGGKCAGEREGERGIVCSRVESVLEAGECLKDVKGTKVEEGGLEGRGKGKGDEGGRRSPRGKEKGETWRWKTWPLFAWAETWPLFAWAYFWFRHDTFF